MISSRNSRARLIARSIDKAHGDSCSSCVDRFCSESDSYFNFAYTVFAAMRMGMSGSASFQRVRNFWNFAGRVSVFLTGIVLKPDRSFQADGSG